MHLCHLDALRTRRAERDIPTGKEAGPGNVLPPIADA
jgi:hypothetical protein